MIDYKQWNILPNIKLEGKRKGKESELHFQWKWGVAGFQTSEWSLHSYCQEAHGQKSQSLIQIPILIRKLRSLGYRGSSPWDTDLRIVFLFRFEHIEKETVIEFCKRNAPALNQLFGIVRKVGANSHVE